MAYVVLADANVLHQMPVAALLQRLAEKGFYRLAWSEEILEEVLNSLCRRRPGNAERFKRRIELMKRAFPDAMVEEVSDFLASVPPQVEVGDRHVVAAALAARADVIVTNNVRHIPEAPLASFSLHVQTPDRFFELQFQIDPEGVLEALSEIAGSFKNPPKSVDSLIADLAVGLPRLAARISEQQ